MDSKLDYGWVIASPATLTVYDLYPTKEAAEDKLAEVKAKCLADAHMCAGFHVEHGYDDRDPAYWLKQAGTHVLQSDDCQAMSWDDYADVEARKLLSRPIQEIDMAAYDDALNVLPPLKWGENNGVRSFFMSEFWSGNYTQQYAQIDSRYFCKLVNYRKPETWINRDMIAVLETASR